MGGRAERLRVTVFRGYCIIPDFPKNKYKQKIKMFNIIIIFLKIKININ